MYLPVFLSIGYLKAQNQICGHGMDVEKFTPFSFPQFLHFYFILVYFKKIFKLVLSTQYIR